MSKYVVVEYFEVYFLFSLRRATGSPSPSYYKILALKSYIYVFRTYNFKRSTNVLQTVTKTYIVCL